MKNITEEEIINKEDHLNDDNSKLPNITNQENPNISQQKISSEKDSQDKKDKSISSIKLKILLVY